MSRRIESEHVLTNGAWRLDPFVRVVRWVANPDVPPRELQPCGTAAAYQRHRRYNEPICEPCMTANAANRRRQRRAAAARAFREDAA